MRLRGHHGKGGATGIILSLYRLDLWLAGQARQWPGCPLAATILPPVPDGQPPAKARVRKPDHISSTSDPTLRSFGFTVPIPAANPLPASMAKQETDKASAAVQHPTFISKRRPMPATRLGQWTFIPLPAPARYCRPPHRQLERNRASSRRFENPVMSNIS
jgi:hypothetical protein